VQTNAHGFRDLAREIQKPERVIRIALLGDSFVEAIQVPFNKTAGHLLEQKLNNIITAPKKLSTNPFKYEVLNLV
jgi:hypothetical protein